MIQMTTAGVGSGPHSCGEGQIEGWAGHKHSGRCGESVRRRTPPHSLYAPPGSMGQGAGLFKPLPIGMVSDLSLNDGTSPTSGIHAWQ